MSRIAIVVPARMESSRLPGKPILMVNGLPMIVQTLKRCLEADVGDVYAAVGSKLLISSVGRFLPEMEHRCLLTPTTCPTGSDRVWEAMRKHDYDHIVNVQADSPFICLTTIQECVRKISEEESDVVTAVTHLTDEDKFNYDVVKAYVDSNYRLVDCRRRYYDPPPNTYMYRKLGIYAYKRNALKKFSKLPRSKHEIKEGLEQLRLIENGFDVRVVYTYSKSYSIDTVEQLLNC